MKEDLFVLTPIEGDNRQKAKWKCAVVVAASFLLTFAFASTLLAADPLAKVKGLPIVKNLLPKAEILEAKDIGSLYEIVVSDRSKIEIFYLTKDGKYLVAGNLIDMDKVNLTRQRWAEAQKRWEEVTRIDLSKIPLEDAIVIKKGNGAKKLIMFSDVDCPYCRQAYSWLMGQTNYTLYMFLFPLDIHPKSAGKSVEIFCSNNHEEAIERAQSEKDIGAQKCEAGEKMLAKHKAVAMEIGLEGTPLFVTDTGSRVTGLSPLLEKYLKN